MSWQRVELIVGSAQAELLAEALEEAGAIATEITDADAGTPAESAVFGEPGSDAALWGRCRVGALFPAGHDVPQALVSAFAASDLSASAGRAATVTVVEDADWVELTQRQFEPVRAGERLWIVPSWHEPPDPSAVNVILDPGAAFGTGSHPTTRLCLAWLERNVRAGDEVLDYGCGSGVLAIAALKLGAARARAVDIDPLALEAARYNALRNAVALEVIDAHEAFSGAARITIANILANALRMLAPTIASHTQPGGAIVLCGVLESQCEEVVRAYAPWAQLHPCGREGDWVLLAGERSC